MNEWKKVKLGNLLEEYCERNDNQKYKAVAVGKYGIRKREDIYSKDLSKDISKNKIIKKDTLTIGMGSTQIDIGILTEDDIFCVSPAYTTYKIKKCNSKFLEYYLEYLNPKLSDLFMIVSARQGKNVDKDGMLRHEVMIPPIEEQEKIVKILKNIDSIINKYEKLLEEKNQFIKSQFVEMFGKENWKKVELKSVAEVKGRVGWKGYTKSDLRSEGPLVLGATHLRDDGLLDLTEPVFLSEEKYEESPEIMVKTNDLIFAQRGSLGKIGLVNDNIGKATINPCVLILRPFNINPEFFRMLLIMEYDNGNLERLNSGSTIPMISQKTIGEYKIIMPSIELQNQFEKIVNKTDKQKLLLDKQKQNYEKLKKGLMQQLLTGKIRVKK